MSLLIIAVILLVIYLLFFSGNDSDTINYIEKPKKSKKSKKERMLTTEPVDDAEEENEETNEFMINKNPVNSKCPGFVSSDLLPREDQKDEDFSEFAPSNVEGNFLDSSKFLSMQTSLLRNSNLQIRPDPEIPREDVCPWNNSTIYRENSESSSFKRNIT